VQEEVREALFTPTTIMWRRCLPTADAEYSAIRYRMFNTSTVYIVQTAKRKSVRGIAVRNKEATYEYNEDSGDISVFRKKHDRPQERCEVMGLIEMIIAQGPGYESQEEELAHLQNVVTSTEYIVL